MIRHLADGAVTGILVAGLILIAAAGMIYLWMPSRGKAPEGA